MSLPVRRAARAALIVLAVAALGACASRPKPLGPTAAAPPPPPPREAGPSAVPPPAPVGESEESGVPIPGSARDFVINVGDRVYFDFNQYSVRDDARPLLDSQAAWLRRYGAVRVRIEGNCDELGTREYNFALGARRANAVREYLSGHGVAIARIETISYGKERPVDTGAGETAQAHNRNAHTAITEGAR